MKTLACFVLLLVCCNPGLAADKPREAEADDIYEAVFRFRIDRDSQNRKKIPYYLLVIETKDAAPITTSMNPEQILKELKRSDPSDEFIKRFADIKPPVRKRTYSAEPRAVVNTSNEKESSYLKVMPITWKSDTEVEVRGYSPLASMESPPGDSELGHDFFKLEKRDGKWTVTLYVQSG